MLGSSGLKPLGPPVRRPSGYSAEVHVILFNPRAQKAHRRLPLSLLFLARGLPDQAGDAPLTWQIIDANVQADAKALAEAAIAADPAGTLLLVTVMPGPQLRQAVPWCRQVKALWPAVTVVWGGYFPTVYPDACVADPAVDLVVIGQGEDTVAELVAALGEGRDALTVAGVAGLRGAALHRAPSRAFKVSSKYGDAPYEALDMEVYAAKSFLGDRTFNHHSSVGCPYTCNFCAVTNMFEGRWLADPAAAVVRTLRRLHDDYGADAIEFHDNNFFAAERRCAAVAEGIADLGLRWWGEGRIDTMLGWSDATWQIMADSGLAMVFFGAENADQATLDAMNKGGLQVHETVELNRRAACFDIVPEFSFVLGNPVDPERDIDATLALIRRLKADNPACEIILYMYTPVPLPGMYDQAVAQGFEFPTTLDAWLAPPWTAYEERRNAVTPWHSVDLVRRVYDFEAVLHARYPSVSDRHLGPWKRTILAALAEPRWRSGRVGRPWELKALQKLWHYRRPEEMGF